MMNTYTLAMLNAYCHPPITAFYRRDPSINGEKGFNLLQLTTSFINAKEPVLNSTYRPWMRLLLMIEVVMRRSDSDFEGSNDPYRIRIGRWSDQSTFINNININIIIVVIINQSSS